MGLRAARARPARGQDGDRRPPAAARGAPARHEDRAGDLRRPHASSRRGCSTSPSTRSAATWDEELLARMLADLQPVDDIDLTLTGFAEDELDKLLKSLDVREKREKAGGVRRRRRAGGRTCRHTRPTWRAVGAGRPSAPDRRRDRHAATWRGCWARRGRRCASPTRPTTSPSATTAASSEDRASAASRTTRCRRRSGRPSSAAGRATSSPASTARSTSA